MVVKFERPRSFKEGRGYTKQDWDEVSDNPPITEEALRKAKPFTEAFPELTEEIRRNLGGRPKSENPKLAVSIRLDRDVVEAFKADGEGWQSRINEALRKAAGL